MTSGFWPWLILGLTMIAQGIHQIGFASHYDAEANLGGPYKYAFGSRLDRGWWDRGWGSGLGSIAMGLMAILLGIGDQGTTNPIFMAIVGSVSILVGLWTLFAAKPVLEWLRRRRAKRLLAEGVEVEPKAHPTPVRSRTSDMWFGVIALVFGASCLLVANPI